MMIGKETKVLTRRHGATLKHGAEESKTVLAIIHELTKALGTPESVPALQPHVIFVCSHLQLIL